MNVNRPPFNPQLIRAIYDCIASDTPAARSSLYEALLHSELILPTWNEPDDQGHVTGPVRPMWLGARTGNVLPVFTDWEAVSRWKSRDEARSFVVLHGRGVFVAATGIDAALVFINPDGPVGTPVGRKEISTLAGGTNPELQPGLEPGVAQRHTVKYATFGPPVEPPAEDLVSSLRQALPASSEVDRAFLFQADIGRGSHLTLGIAFRVKPTATMVNDVMRTINPELQRELAVVVLQDEILLHVESQVAPFFKRDR